MRLKFQIVIITAALLAVMAGWNPVTAQNVAVYKEQGGARLVVGSGGSLDVASGGDLDIESGGALKIAGTAISASAAELNILDGATVTYTEINAMVDNIVVAATYVIGSETSDTRTITVTLKNAAGSAIDNRAAVLVGVFVDAAAAAYCSSCGSTGIADGGDGESLAIVAKKLYTCTSTTAGVITLLWTDTGTDAVYIGVILPNGKIALSAIVQNAT